MFVACELRHSLSHSLREPPSQSYQTNMQGQARHPIRQTCHIELLVHGDGADASGRAWTLNTVARVKSHTLNPSALTMPLTNHARTEPWIVSGEYNIMLWRDASQYSNDRREDCATFSDEPAMHFATVLVPVIVIVNNHMPIAP
jgi:hypothetical protein